MNYDKSAEYYFKRTGLDRKGQPLYEVTKFPDGADQPESTYTLRDRTKEGKSILCQCWGGIKFTTGKYPNPCRHAQMLDMFKSAGEPLGWCCRWDG